MENENQKKSTGFRSWSIRKKLIVGCSAALIIAVAGILIYFLPDIINPMAQFNTVAQQVSAGSSASETPPPENTDAVQSSGGDSTQTASTDTATPDPYEQLVQQSDFSILQNTVNILLIGVDDAPERLTPGWIKNGGKSGANAFHSDVMIVLSINKETNKVSLISLPRDTYAKIPGYTGVYKLNASINCGGGWPKDEGCKEVCKAASWMIGGLPIQYYYAVDMSAVKGLVDAIGGVDFNIDINYSIDGRSYKAGPLHMNGQAVLDYLRVRKKATHSIQGITGSSETGDLNRINRQKNMLVAIFKKIKSQGLITDLPRIIGAFNGDLVTNVSLAQTAALAAYSRDIDADSIKMYSMDGNYYDLFYDNFVITDQGHRQQIIKDVFGVDIVKDKRAIKDKYGVSVPSYSDYTASSAVALWENMQKEVTGTAADKVLKKVKSMLATYTPPPTPVPTPTETPTATTPGVTPTPTPTSFHDAALALYNKTESEYEALMAWDTTKNQNTQFIKSIGQFQSDIKKLCAMFSIKVPSWTVIYRNGSNQSYVKNQVVVDFR